MTVNVIVVYDTAAERNPRILGLCRRYLHHVQRSVFEGSLSAAQLQRFQHEVRSVIVDSYDHVLIYTLPPGVEPRRIDIGTGEPAPSNVL
ncbi:MAG TPA: CRISPR-associated endonuclease Cas2 [Pseudonocardiaceae bacterium]|nr:CRISPR-associated endonuclease Cas2 [Pseudonocardiaceae bacterium]